MANINIEISEAALTAALKGELLRTEGKYARTMVREICRKVITDYVTAEVGDMLQTFMVPDPNPADANRSVPLPAYIRRCVGGIVPQVIAREVSRVTENDVPRLVAVQLREGLRDVVCREVAEELKGLIQ